MCIAVVKSNIIAIRRAQSQPYILLRSTVTVFLVIIANINGSITHRTNKSHPQKLHANINEAGCFIKLYLSVIQFQHVASAYVIFCILFSTVQPRIAARCPQWALFVSRATLLVLSLESMAFGLPCHCEKIYSHQKVNIFAIYHV